MKYNFQCQDFKADQIVVSEGSSCEKIYLIRSGEFRIVKSTASLIIPNFEKDFEDTREAKRIMTLSK